MARDWVCFMRFCWELGCGRHDVSLHGKSFIYALLSEGVGVGFGRFVTTIWEGSVVHIPHRRGCGRWKSDFFFWD